MSISKQFKVKVGIAFLAFLYFYTGHNALSDDSSDRIIKVLHPTQARREAMDIQATNPIRDPGILNAMTYHGGPLMLGTTHVYYIWYGNWSNNTATKILPFLAKNIGNTSYMNINTTYHSRFELSASNSVSYKGSIVDHYSRGMDLSDNDVAAIVTSAIQGSAPRYQSGKLPYDSNGVYFVLTSADVSEKSGFCTDYCGWHSFKRLYNGNIKFAFVGNSDRCLSACASQTTSPNDNPGADGMASIIAHELSETITDPLLNAWYDRNGNENADKCSWSYGDFSVADNGSVYNIVLGGMKFLIQQNWANARGGYCTMSY